MAYPRTLTVKVAQDDIDMGLPNDCQHCPIAQAAVRALTGRMNPSDLFFVYPWGLRVYDTHGTNLLGEGGYVMTEVARQFMRRFDHEQPVKPHNFRFRIAA